MPLQNYIVIKPIHEKENEMAKSGLILPSQADIEPTNKGQVMLIGDEVKLPIKVGDVVLFKPHLFDALDDGGGIILIGREEGVYAKFPNTC